MEEYIESVRKQADEILKCMRSTFAAEKKTRGLINKDFAHISNMSEDAIKLLLSEKSKNPSYVSVVSLGTSLGLDLNALAGYTPPQKADTSVVAVIDENYVAEIIRLCESRVEDIKAMCEKMIADRDAMWEARLADNNTMWEKLLSSRKEVGSYLTLE